MDTQILLIVLPLVGVIIGSLIAFAGNLLSKRQERKSQVYKLLIEKRIEVYEKILGVAQSGQLGTYKIVNGEKVSRPLVLAKEANSFTWFYLNTIEVTRNYNHLIDIELRRKLLELKNYLVNLNELLTPQFAEDGKWKDEEIIERLGYILHDDFQKLSSAIEVEISKFFSKRIYDIKFKPASLDEKKLEIPPYFLELNLFKREDEIVALLKEGEKERLKQSESL